MVTLFQVTDAKGLTKRCTSACHNSTAQRCRCPCGGRFHGKQEGTAAFAYALRMHLTDVLLDLSLREAAGILWIDGYRLTTTGPWLARTKDSPFSRQGELFGLLVEEALDHGKPAGG